MIKRKVKAWREYLKGNDQEYTQKVNENQVYLNKMRHEIRDRAKKIMADLLLIAEKSSERDKILIFKNPETREKLVIPLIVALMRFNKPGDTKLEHIMDLGRTLKSVKVKYDLIKLMKNDEYRKRKWIKLFLAWGFNRKEAVRIAEEREKALLD